MEEELTSNLWKCLNPFGNESVEKAATFDFLLLLIFNVSH